MEISDRARTRRAVFFFSSEPFRSARCQTLKSKPLQHCFDPTDQASDVTAERAQTQRGFRHETLSLPCEKGHVGSGRYLEESIIVRARSIVEAVEKAKMAGGVKKSTQERLSGASVLRAESVRDLPV